MIAERTKQVLCLTGGIAIGLTATGCTPEAKAKENSAPILVEGDNILMMALNPVKSEFNKLGYEFNPESVSMEEIESDANIGEFHPLESNPNVFIVYHSGMDLEMVFPGDIRNKAEQIRFVTKQCEDINANKGCEIKDFVLTPDVLPVHP